jgi:hypothetical protein
LLPVLDGDECAIGAPTLVAARLWCSVNLRTHASDWLEHFIEGGPGTIVPFSRDMADVASEAFIKFGRASGHPARLNFGDCLTYAVSAVTRAPRDAERSKRAGCLSGRMTPAASVGPSARALKNGATHTQRVSVRPAALAAEAPAIRPKTEPETRPVPPG